MSDEEFGDWWVLLKKHLMPHTRIPRWSAAKGYIHGSFTVSPSPHIGEEYVQIEGTDDIYQRKISRDDFRAVLHRWDEYRAGVIARQRINAVTMHSTYVIGIIRWLEEKVGRD